MQPSPTPAHVALKPSAAELHFWHVAENILAAVSGGSVISHSTPAHAVFPTYHFGLCLMSCGVLDVLATKEPSLCMVFI